MSTARNKRLNHVQAKTVNAQTYRGNVITSIQDAGPTGTSLINSGAPNTALLKRVSAGVGTNFVGSSAEELIINSTAGGIFPEPNAFYVSPAGNDGNSGKSAADPFLTINKAIAEIALAGGTNKLELLAGAYVIDNSAGALSVPADTAIVSPGGEIVVMISPSDPTQPMLSFAGKSAMHGIFVTGVTSGPALLFDGAVGNEVYFDHLEFENNDICIDAQNTLGTSSGLHLYNIHTDSTGGANNYILQMSNNAVVYSMGGVIDDVVVNAFNMLDNTCNLYVNGARFRNCAQCFTIQGGDTHLMNCFARDCTTFIEAAGTGLAPLIESCSTRACAVDLNISGTTGRVIFAHCYGDQPIILNPNAVSLQGTFFESQVEEASSMVFFSELQVGTPQIPTEAAIGEGDSTIVGMRIFSETSGGVFTEYTSEAQFNDAVTFPAFDDLAAGSSFYVGGTFPFTGIRVTTTAAIDYGASGAITYEYGVNADPVTAAPALNTFTDIGNIMNNNAEFPFHICVRNADAPYNILVTPATGPLARAPDIFGTVESDQVRFGPMRYWEQTTVNGVTAYWMRIRITSALTTSPILDRIKLGTNRLEVNKDGFIEYFGSAEAYQRLPFNINSVSRSTVLGNPSDQTLSLSDDISVGLLNNGFRGGQRDGFGFNTSILESVDTAKPLVVRIQFIMDGGTMVGTKLRIPLYYANQSLATPVYKTTGLPASVGRVAYPTQADADPVGGINTTFTVPGGTVTTTALELTYALDIHDYSPSTDGGTTADMIWMSLIREGGDVTDTYTGSIYIFDFEGAVDICKVGAYDTFADGLFKP